jgi:hypothetical protein
MLPAEISRIDVLDEETDPIAPKANHSFIPLVHTDKYDIITLNSMT